MAPYACIVVAAIVLALLPGKAFAPRGLRSIRGLGSLVGNAAQAGAPGALWLQADPGATLAAYGLAVAGAVITAAALLATRIRFVAVPARPAPSAPAAVVPAAGEPAPVTLPENGAISPVMLQRVELPVPSRGRVVAGAAAARP